MKNFSPFSTFLFRMREDVCVKSDTFLLLFTPFLHNLVSFPFTVFENHRKSLIQHNIASYGATFTFWVAKNSLKMPKMVILASFWKPEDCGQTVLPDRSLFLGQKLLENAKIEKNATFCVIFKHCVF